MLLNKIITDITEDEWDLMLNIHLKGTFFTCRAVVPQMMERKKEKSATLFLWEDNEAFRKYVKIYISREKSRNQTGGCGYCGRQNCTNGSLLYIERLAEALI